MSLDLGFIYFDRKFTVDNSCIRKTYEFERFRLDSGSLMLYRDNEAVELPPRAIETLLVLVEEQGRILSKGELMDKIWPDLSVEESNLAKYLHLLRKTLGDQESGKPFIETFRRRGYRFNAPVRNINADYEVPAASDKDKNGHPFEEIVPVIRGVATSDLTGPSTQSRPPTIPVETSLEGSSNVRVRSVGLRRWLGAAVVVSIAIAAAVVFLQDVQPTQTSSFASVAVLPFENETGDPSFDYLSDGLSQGLIDRLSEMPQVSVVARSSSSRYRIYSGELSDVAAKLGAEMLIAGRLGRSEDGLNVHVELVEPRAQRQILGEQFKTPIPVPAEFEKRILRSVTGKLQLQLTPQQDRQLAKEEPVSPEAYEHLLRGRSLRNGAKGEAWLKATEHFERVVAAAPNHAIGYAELAAHYVVIANASLVDPKVVLPKAGVAAKKAVELDDQLAEAHVALGEYYLDNWEWQASESEYRRAIELNPRLARARYQLSRLLTCLGRHEEAIGEARLSRDLDPASAEQTLNLGLQLSHARRFDEAITEFQRIPLQDLDNRGGYLTSFAFAGKGMYREALAEWEKRSAYGNTVAATIWAGVFHARAGNLQEARNVLRRIENTKEYISPSELAVLYVNLGEHDKAFESLEKAYAAHDLQLKHIKYDWLLDPIRDDPRFQDLLQRIGLDG